MKNISRAILNENAGNTTTGGTLPSNYSYEGYAARLLTIQEVRKAAQNDNIPTWNVGKLETVNYLMENTKYSSDDNAAYAWWLENPFYSSSSSALYIHGWTYIDNYSSVSVDKYGVRPAIEVSKTDIDY